MKALLRRLEKFKEELVIFGYDNEGCLVLKVGLVYFTFFKDANPTTEWFYNKAGFNSFRNSNVIAYEIMRVISENK